MSRRVIISSSMLRVAAAGADAATASGDALLFDPVRDGYNGAMFSGVVNWAAAGWTSSVSSFYTSNDTTTYTYRLSFGRTLPSRPRMLVAVSSPFLNSGLTLYPYYQLNFRGSGGSIVWMLYGVDTTGATFKVIRRGSGSEEYRLNFIYTAFWI